MGILGLILLSSSIVQQFSLQAIRSSVHNRAHVRLGLKKFKYKNPFSYLCALLIPVASCCCSILDVSKQRTAGTFPLILKIHLPAFLLFELF